MKKHKCLCEQEAGMGNVKSTRLEELEYKLDRLLEDVFNIHRSYTNIESLRSRIDNLDEKIKLTFFQVLRLKINEWLHRDDKTL